MNFFPRQLLVHVQMSRGSYLLALSPPLMPHHQLYLMLFHSLLWATAALVSGKDTLPPLCFPISDQAITVSWENNINLWPCSSLHSDWKKAVAQMHSTIKIPTWNLWGLHFLWQLSLNLRVALCCIIKKHLEKGNWTQGAEEGIRKVWQT